MSGEENNLREVGFQAINVLTEADVALVATTLVEGDSDGAGNEGGNVALLKKKKSGDGLSKQKYIKRAERLQKKFGKTKKSKNEIITNLELSEGETSSESSSHVVLLGGALNEGSEESGCWSGEDLLCLGQACIVAALVAGGLVEPATDSV